MTMLKHLMSGASLISLALRDADTDERAALRAKIAGGAKVEVQSDAEKEAKDDKAADDKSDNEGSDKDDDDTKTDDEDEESEEDKEEDDDKVKETDEEKAEREKQEKLAAKSKRKEDRMQARINEATKLKNEAVAEVERLKAQLAADPDKKLSPEEIETRAKAIAQEELSKKELEKINDDFNATCTTLAKDARKTDKDFDNKVEDMADQFGKIPSFMIGVLGDLDNGGEVLAYLANDDDEAERLYNLTQKPAKMAKELALISLKLEEAKKPPKKQISKVKGIDTVKNSGNNKSAVLTEADAKNMDNYVAKRIRMKEEQKKARGY